MGDISLSKSLRTPKVTPGPTEYAQSFRLFNTPLCENLQNYAVDQFGRPGVSPNSGYPLLNTSLGNFGACYSPLYLIETENMISRPSYSQYLNVPQGVMMMQSEYQNRPNTDLMGVQRNRAFGLDGTYQYPAFPAQSSLNPASDKSFLEDINANRYRLLGQFDSRMWQNSAETGY